MWNFQIGRWDGCDTSTAKLTPKMIGVAAVSRILIGTTDPILQWQAGTVLIWLILLTLWASWRNELLLGQSNT